MQGSFVTCGHIRTKGFTKQNAQSPGFSITLPALDYREKIFEKMRKNLLSCVNKSYNITNNEMKLWMRVWTATILFGSSHLRDCLRQSLSIRRDLYGCFHGRKWCRKTEWATPQRRDSTIPLEDHCLPSRPVCASPILRISNPKLPDQTTTSRR